jgi:hypothetical protein
MLVAARYGKVVNYATIIEYRVYQIGSESEKSLAENEGDRQQDGNDNHDLQRAKPMTFVPTSIFRFHGDSFRAGGLEALQAKQSRQYGRQHDSQQIKHHRQKKQNSLPFHLLANRLAID